VVMLILYAILSVIGIGGAIVFGALA